MKEFAERHRGRDQRDALRRDARRRAVDVEHDQVHPNIDDVNKEWKMTFERESGSK